MSQGGGHGERSSRGIGDRGVKKGMAMPQKAAPSNDNPFNAGHGGGGGGKVISGKTHARGIKR